MNNELTKFKPTEKSVVVYKSDDNSIQLDV